MRLLRLVTDRLRLPSNWTISAKLSLLSCIMLVALVSSSLYLRSQLVSGSDALHKQTRLHIVGRTATDALRSFGELKYWLTDLQVTWLNESETNAEQARAMLNKHLRKLSPFAPEKVKKIQKHVERFVALSLKAVDSYTGGNRVLGNSYVSKARTSFDAVDRALVSISKKLAHKAASANVIANKDSEFARLVSLIVLFAVGALVLILTLLTIRSVVRPMKEIEVSKRHLAKANENLRQEVSLRKKAKIETARAKRRLEDAIESMSEGFALYDADDRLVVFNNKYREYLDNSDDIIKIGVRFEDIVRSTASHAREAKSQAEIEAFVRKQVELHRNPGGDAIELKIENGRWLRIQERVTSEGGIVGLRADITELKNRELELKRSNEELESFAYIASHDLQEPLRKVQAFGDRLSRKYAGDLPEDGQRYIERMQDAAARMQILIGDLLAFARITTEGRKFEPVDLKAIVGEVVEDLEARLIETGGRVEIGKLPTIDADPVQIRQLFQNLIANALKFNKPGEAPLIRVRASNGNGRSRSKNRDAAVPVGECEITVKDNCIGFEPEHGEQIFEIFKRLHGRSEYEGTGIGLAICRRIVERHGGTIAVDAKPGKGATFYIRIPVQQRQAVPIDEAA